MQNQRSRDLTFYAAFSLLWGKVVFPPSEISSAGANCAKGFPYFVIMKTSPDLTRCKYSSKWLLNSVIVIVDSLISNSGCGHIIFLSCLVLQRKLGCDATPPSRDSSKFVDGLFRLSLHQLLHHGLWHLHGNHFPTHGDNTIGKDPLFDDDFASLDLLYSAAHFEFDS